MSADEDAQDVTARQPGVSRRTLVKGAAWSVPAVAIAVAAPIASASVPCEGAGSQTFNAPSSSSPRNVAFTVPAGVTQLSYVVTGGAGGSVHGSNGNQNGGQGGRVTGTIDVTPGEVLQVYVGQGGEGTTSDVNGPVQRAGGRGYGDGGSAGAPPGDNSPNYVKWNSGAGGGGGSAIVRGSTPLVVAGGGGGGGGVWIEGATNTFSIGSSRPGGGNAGNNGGSWVFGSSGGESATIYGGKSGSSGQGGTGGTYGGPWPQAPVFQNGGSASSRNGGVSWGGGISVNNNDGWSASGGGGGGGYGGGGGGETMWGFTDNQGAGVIAGGGGGGGTSYIVPGGSGTIGLSGTTASPGSVVDGSVVLSWDCA